MKKIFTLFAVAACFAGVASAQTFEVFVNGDKVESGMDILSTRYHETFYEGPDLPDYGYINGETLVAWDLGPEIILKMNSAATVYSDIKNLSNTSVQYCVGACFDVPAGESRTLNCEFSAGETTPSQVSLHWSSKDDMYQACAPTEKVSLPVELSFYLAGGAEKVSFNLTMEYDPAKEAVNGIEAVNAPAVYFDLSGRRVNGDLDKGIYVKVQNGKSSKVLVK